LIEEKKEEKDDQSYLKGTLFELVMQSTRPYPATIYQSDQMLKLGYSQ
jgi:hypothetical protein